MVGRKECEIMSHAVKGTVPKQKVVCVLGMHRSGTSMITKVINLMGVFLGKAEDMMPANKDVNAEGYWEHLKIIEIHEEILKEFNSSWDSAKPLPEKWWELPKIKQYKDKLIELIKSEFSNTSIWGFKDPRTCIMMPMWKEIFEVLDIEPMFVIPIRNPIDIANSLMKRDDFSLNYSMRLWYYYTINILEGTKGYHRMFIQYDDMIENSDLNLIQLMDFLSIDDSEGNKKYIKESLKPNLRHSKTKTNELNLVASGQVVELYDICMKLIENPYNTFNLKSFSNKVYRLYGDLMGSEYDADKNIEKYLTSLFMDYGMGFSEETSIKQEYTLNENREFNVHFELGQRGENIKHIRWDPLVGIFCKCIIDNILVNNTPIKIENSNADYSNEKEFDFLTIYPMCFWKNNYETVRTISVSGRINIYVPLQLQCFLKEKKERIITINEKLNYYENENNRLIKEKQQIILRNETKEKEVMNTINGLEGKYKILLDENIKLDQETHKILNSPSWKMTKPLRSMKRIFIKLIQLLS